MRKTLILAVAMALAVSLGAAATAPAAACTCWPFPNLVSTIGASVSPRKLPAGEFAPATWSLFGKVMTNDGTHPSALREAVIDIDKDVKINVKGYPVCKASQLKGRSIKAAIKACDAALLGDGEAHVEVAFPNESPAILASRLLVFNGGERDDGARLLIHAVIAESAPTAIVTVVTMERKGTGLHSIAKIPVIADGMGSLLDFSFKVGKVFVYDKKKVGYFEAKCPDSVFRLNVPKLLLRNEAGTPQVTSTTVFKGGVAVPCTPKG